MAVMKLWLTTSLLRPTADVLDMMAKATNLVSIMFIPVSRKSGSGAAPGLRMMETCSFSAASLRTESLAHPKGRTCERDAENVSKRLCILCYGFLGPRGMAAKLLMCIQRWSTQAKARPCLLTDPRGRCGPCSLWLNNAYHHARIGCPASRFLHLASKDPMCSSFGYCTPRCDDGPSSMQRTKLKSYHV